jgi:arginine:ornithine antiporter/lysine permease
VDKKQLGLWSLMAAVVGTMIGGGAFNLPKDMAAAGSGAVLIAWVITGIGMIALALVFQNLSLRKGELAGGIYSYAKAGFGPFVGFSSAWGYWISTILGNVSFVVLLLSTLNYFVPVFGGGNNAAALIAGSLFVWMYHILIMRGVKEAAVVNIVTTVGKLMPIFLFITFLFFAFDRGIFVTDFWGMGGAFSWDSVLTQVKDTMLVTLWAFVGVEGAVVLSGRAKRQQDVGRATVIGLIGTLIVYMLISVLSIGVLSREELAALPEPSMAYVLEHVVGPWGAAVINIGLIVSIIGAMLSWTLLAIEIPFVAAVDGMFPQSFTRENRKGTPVVSLWWTSGITQLFVIVVYFQESTYQIVYSMASVAVLLPYLLTALYQLKLIRTGETYESGKSKTRDRFIGWLATLYSVWLLYAAGMEYVLMVAALYLAGFLLYIRVQTRHGRRILAGWDWFPAMVIVGAGVAAVWLMAVGKLQP